MGIDLLEKPAEASEADKPKPEAPIDYAEAANRYAAEAQDPKLSPLEKQAKEDIVAFAAKRAQELAVSKDAPQNTPENS